MLGDFGLSAKVRTIQKKDTFAGSVYWMAPEVIALESVSIASDSWSLGCSIIEMLLGEPPLKNLAPPALCYKVIKAGLSHFVNSLYQTGSISFDLTDFLLRCLEHKPAQRIITSKMQQHIWLQ
eukprot:TRINITY_DN20273_c0_g1_i1.p1 TRINITY_DN20273_c0_g1~~TRINITY_DN20273_c0_g1_i1.p1  ORF type:complete len:123 (+),score=13.35 TRINITY_DN20273_c0_g1_i1:249-617(+)